MCIALTGLCATAQEKGDMAVGVNLGAAPCLESGVSVTNFQIGAKFQYNISNPFRVEAAFDYGFKNKGIDMFDLAANVHYLIGLGEKFKLYPIVGVGFAHAKASASIDFEYDDEDYNYEVSASVNKFMFNAGLGAEYPVSDKLSIGAEIKYQYIQDFSRLPISVGVTYKF